MGGRPYFWLYRCRVSSYTKDRSSAFSNFLRKWSCGMRSSMVTMWILSCILATLSCFFLYYTICWPPFRAFFSIIPYEIAFVYFVNSSNFDVKLPAANHKEDETFEEDCRLMQKYMVYMDVLTNKFTNCTKIWQEFFRLWIKSIEVQIEDGEFAPKDSLKTLFSHPEVKFLTFNYTKTLQELYGIKK